ncbi:hypothetical protein E2C01_072895 [Portunus trituberculatus]|uniref:Uncharacterized protein n=1 Tax=Portunus trituberculatus TaxID=210409 RepID=A0A5B7I945_PORTR|nr:hypothetical protein [Portunus trituberculatus]
MTAAAAHLSLDALYISPPLFAPPCLYRLFLLAISLVYYTVTRVVMHRLECSPRQPVSGVWRGSPPLHSFIPGDCDPLPPHPYSVYCYCFV